MHRQPQSQLCLLLMSHIWHILSLMFYLDVLELSCSGIDALFSCSVFRAIRFIDCKIQFNIPTKFRDEGNIFNIDLKF